MPRIPHDRERAAPLACCVTTTKKPSLKHPLAEVCTFCNIIWISVGSLFQDIAALVYSALDALKLLCCRDICSVPTTFTSTWPPLPLTHQCCEYCRMSGLYCSYLGGQCRSQLHPAVDYRSCDQQDQRIYTTSAKYHESTQPQADQNTPKLFRIFGRWREQRVLEMTATSICRLAQSRGLQIRWYPSNSPSVQKVREKPI